MELKASNAVRRGLWKPTRERRAVALLMTLLVLTLLLAVTTELIAVTAAQSVVTAMRSATLHHQLAADGALLVLEERLQPRHVSSLIETLDRTGVLEIDLSLGGVEVKAWVRDDAVKMNPALWPRDDQALELGRALSALQPRYGLPTARIQLRPLVVERAADTGFRYRWFDQVLADLVPNGLFRWEESVDGVATRPVWSDVVTFWGDGRIDLRRADARLLDAALADLGRGLGQKLLAARPADRSLDFRNSALMAIDAEIRPRVAARITFDARRYAVRLDTAIAADRRRAYVVAQGTEAPLTLLHRSAITW